MPNELKIVIDADVSKAVTGVQQGGRIIVGEFNKIANAGAAAANELKSSFGDFGKVSLDSTQVTTAIDQIKTRLSTLQGQVSITVTAEGLQKLNADIAQAKADLNSLVTKNIKIDVDATTALQKITLLKGNLAAVSNVPFKFNTQPAIQAISGLQNQVHRLDQSLKTVGGLNAFQSALGKSTTAIKNFQASGAGLNNFFGQVAAASGRASASLQKLPTATNASSFALLNFGRVIQDAPFGILGIANNLNPLIESLQRASAAAKATGTSIGKNLLGALTGAGGIGFAVSAISSLLIVFGDRLFGAGKKAADAGSEVKSFGQIVADSTGSVQGDLAKVNALVKAATDSANGLQVQKRAIEELQKINKSYFGELVAGKSTYDEITKAANAYTEALVNQAVINGLSNAISKLSEEYGNLFIKYQDQTKAANDARKALDKTIATNRTNVQGVTAQNREVNLATNSFNKLQAELGQTGNELGKIGTRIKDFTSQIQTAVGVQLKLKPLDVTKIAPAKNVTDDILARARQFVKEFGDVFVLPNLEDSFFTKKEDLLKAAGGLLKNVKDFIEGDVSALKLKIPVFTDFEFLPEETKLTDAQIQELTKGFFEGIKLERGVPVEITPDITLDKTFRDKIDQKLDLKAKFSILGDIGDKEFDKIFKNIDTLDFSALNAGIAEATKTLQGMMEIATTLNQAVGQGMVSAFNSVFDAILEGKNVFKALGQALKELVANTIKAVAQMLILKAITNLIFPGAGVAGKAGGLVGALVGSANFGGNTNFGTGGIGSRAFNNVININVIGQLSGDMINLAGQRASNSQGRFG